MIELCRRPETRRQGRLARRPRRADHPAVHGVLLARRLGVDAVPAADFALYTIAAVWFLQLRSDDRAEAGAKLGEGRAGADAALGAALFDHRAEPTEARQRRPRPGHPAGRGSTSRPGACSSPRAACSSTWISSATGSSPPRRPSTARHGPITRWVHGVSGRLPDPVRRTIRRRGRGRGRTYDPGLDPADALTPAEYTPRFRLRGRALGWNAVPGVLADDRGSARSREERLDPSRLAHPGRRGRASAAVPAGRRRIPRKRAAAAAWARAGGSAAVPGAPAASPGPRWTRPRRSPPARAGRPGPLRAPRRWQVRARPLADPRSLSGAILSAGRAPSCTPGISPRGQQPGPVRDRDRPGAATGESSALSEFGRVSNVLLQ